MYYLPSLGVIFAQVLTKVLVPTGADGLVLLAVHVDLIGILFEVGHVLGGVTALKNRVGGL